MSTQKCIHCAGDATKILERAELGHATDRIAVCDKPECQPSGGDWATYGLETEKTEAPR